MSPIKLIPHQAISEQIRLILGIHTPVISYLVVSRPSELKLPWVTIDQISM
jgi:hypothetical protein